MGITHGEARPFPVFHLCARGCRPGSRLCRYSRERRYNFVTKKYEFYDGADWYNFELGVSLGACTNEAETEFSTLLGIFQYCNGTNWIRLVGTPDLKLLLPGGHDGLFQQQLLLLQWAGLGEYEGPAGHIETP
jgi:hypothetical protein